ncbi:MAG TPA: M28 family metallopeptidase [Gemmatimonadales bacterium]|nr:M28 family metallopeptidase [Gemmatimonadales bacterium]
MSLAVRSLPALALTVALVGAAPEDRDWERRFRDIPSQDSLRSYMRRLAARPHHLGSARGRENAGWIHDRFAAWGWDARIETFDVLFPTPRERVVELVAPRPFRARLDEPVVPGDPTTAQKAEQLPGYHAYSIDGDVTAPLVYVNYGLPADYERLERLGVSVKGAIVIARYGQSWRGIKPKVAAEHCAVGAIIYSDPQDDGYFTGDVYPGGPMRPGGGVQRGSVADMPYHPGDPLTPGRGATSGAERLELKDAKTLTRIPVLPISYADAEPLLRALAGPVAPAEWRGALPLTYHLGPGPARVHLRVRFDWKLRTVHNVVARIPGAQAPDEWVVRGNHHDAWVNGATDPVSGMVAVLEEARAMGELLKQGWRPRRTIVYAAWDGEEQGLLGSTEWVEAHADELAEKAVAYLNTDSNNRGFLEMGGSHSLEALINGVAEEIEDPETGLSVGTRARLRAIARATADERKEIRARSGFRIDPLGSGSDYTPFLQHLGIASLNLGFGGEGSGSSGVYHSIYDDYRWFSRFGDTSFAYGRALARTAGTAVMRLADAEVLPHRFGPLHGAVAKYAGEVKQLLAERQEAAREHNRQIDEGVFTATRDPWRPEAEPPREEVPPPLDFAPLDSALLLLGGSAAGYDSLMDRWTDERMAARPAAPAAFRELNARLIAVERALARNEGLPGRPWYRHQIYAPGLYTGYGVKTLPGVREAIEQRRWDEAQAQIARLADVLGAAARAIDEAATALRRLEA